MFRKIVVSLESIAASLAKIAEHLEETKKLHTVYTSQREQDTNKMQNQLFDFLNKFIVGGSK